MSLLSVTVKKARFVGENATQFNTYVTLKLQNVKSTTVTVKGDNPCWEQDFLFETDDLNTGLLVEVWSKGMIWDRAMGYNYIPLDEIQYTNEEGSGNWLSLDSELVMRDGEVVGTKNPTGHALLLDSRFELPFDPENTDAADLQRKLELLNNVMDQESRAEQARRQLQYYGHCYSEDSDYTSDFNYPIGQNANSSASQYRSAMDHMNTPMRSLESSRENSYEKEDVAYQQNQLPVGVNHYPGHSQSQRRRPEQEQMYSPSYEEYGNGDMVDKSGYNYNESLDSEPLFYNSRPRNNNKQQHASYSPAKWKNLRNGESNYNENPLDVKGGALNQKYIVNSLYYVNCQPAPQPKPGMSRRRPSLERQTTLYDEQSGCPNDYYPAKFVNKDEMYPDPQNYENCCDTSLFPCEESRFGQEDEDRQWDSGGYYKNTPQTYYENHLNKRQKPGDFCSQVNRQDDLCCNEPSMTQPGRRRIPKIPEKRSTSRQNSFQEFDSYYESGRTSENASHRGASLPPTPSTTPKLLQRLAAQSKPSASLPPTPGRQLPKLNHRNARRKNQKVNQVPPVEYVDSGEYPYDDYYSRPTTDIAQVYNEDYNYAYQSIDNIPIPSYEQNITNVPAILEYSATPLLDPTEADLTYTSQMANGDCYYAAQDTNVYRETYEDSPLKTHELKSLPTHSPLRQNTNSLDSNHDEMKDSFETAASSLSNSLAHMARRGVAAVAAVKLPSFSNIMDSANKQPVVPPAKIPEWDHEPVKPLNGALRDHAMNIENKSDVYVNQSTNHANQIDDVSVCSNTPTNAYLQKQDSLTRGYFKQDSIDQSEYYDDALTTNDTRDVMNNFERQDSIESYTEEDVHRNGSLDNYKKDSPIAMIHAENDLTVQDDQNVDVDHYKQQPDYYPAVSSRRSSIDPYRTASPARRMSEDNPDIYEPRKSSIDQYISPRKSSIDPYTTSLMKRNSVRLPSVTSEIHKQDSIDQISPTIDVLDDQILDEEIPEKKQVSFEEEEEMQPRREVTAKQRWHWAYNKIIMQLNVSSNFYSYLHN